MNDFAGNEEMLQDFLQEAGDLLSDVDNKLVDLEKDPGDKKLLNDIFRNFHTIKGGAGFLNATEMVKLCHLTENLFDKLRNEELTMNPVIMDAIFAATGVVRDMFGSLAHFTQPAPADASLIATLTAVVNGEAAVPAAAPVPQPASSGGPDWAALHQSISGAPALEAPAPAKAASAEAPPKREPVHEPAKTPPAATAKSLPWRRKPRSGSIRQDSIRYSIFPGKSG